jgi:hypothetical protein
MKKRKRPVKKKEKKYIHIFLAIYRCTVLVTWEQDTRKIMRYCNNRGSTLGDSWKKDFEGARERGAVGLCIKLGEADTNVPDYLVWLKERPQKASQYGVLYHELFHAVDAVADSRAMWREPEARAFLFEYLVDCCNRVSWV